MLALLVSLAFVSVANSRRVVLAPVLGNYPGTSVSLSDNAAVTPDSPPVNTTATNVSTSSNFKGRLEGYPATGIIRITDAHPAGSYTITVRAFDNNGVNVTKSFMLTVMTPATCLPVSFAAVRTLNADNGPYSIAVGDFNGDGKQDLAVTNVSSNSVSSLLGNGDGSFRPPMSFAVGNDPVSVTVGDLNGDGKQDLAVANIGSDSVSILLGNGDGSFGPAPNVAVGRYPYSVAMGDFNGDGKQDLATANNQSDNASILLGDGTGNFGIATNFQVGSNPISVAVGDFNRDGHQDVAVSNYSSNSVSVCSATVMAVSALPPISLSASSQAR
jgi:hypothetical protein